MLQLRDILFLILMIICWGGLTFSFIKDGNVWAAFFASLPFIAYILVTISPRSGPGFFAFTYPLGPKEEVEESERQYHLKMAKWWLIGFLTLPIGLLLPFCFNVDESFMLIAMFIGVIFGIPCFIKLLGSLYHASRAQS